MDWGAALKIGGPSVLASFVFSQLIIAYLERAELIKSSLLLNIILLLVIFIFCSFMGWLWLSSKSSKPTESGVLDNEINGNEVENSMKVGEGQNVERNEINDNKVKGDLVVGGKE
ncbi:hypothetical protein F753_21230 [Stutzerimonas chloritidismutans AW-1]|jgi:hypothetical protein|uniref:Uncharacterized protein n=1 Tax=Stutzerimonas chloritidismutans AW-1 TaxID=1263865 RepID=V4Q6L0_STUCH|nr:MULTISPECIES: hypothetical protein [Pseudomonadaceae]ESQ97382.1 hypothetical protein F753_21230 [Stutzerimonas chloritidismutans AW-1]MCL8047458.1 hypothetical protein [Pseudomonas aeruginosa]MCU9024992.1 hypothetical protein [Pseudomonas aeruginosa]TXR35460.1 hypothetical protein FVE88_20565 [Pseudomonas mendocina]